MDERARRVGTNEALFRAVNEQIERVNEQFGEPGPTIEVLCECGDAECMARIVVPPDTYREVRDRAERFLLVPGHEDPDVEVVVARQDGWAIVEKRAGGPAELAAEHTPPG